MNSKQAKKKINKLKRNVRRVVRTNRRRNRRRVRTIRNLRRRIRTNRNQIRSNRLIGFRNLRRSMRIERSSNNSMIVSGTDLVYNIPDVYMQKGSKIVAVIPCNPAYWKGTRISTLCAAYQQYRPLRFRVHYVPIASALERGALFCGALFANTPINAEAMDQTFSTMPGKMTTQVSKPKSARVPLGKQNLDKWLYPVAGDLNYESNPFYYIATVVGNFQNEERIVPGFFWVSYRYMFRTPTVNQSLFFNTGMIKYSELQYKTHTTVLNCAPMEFEVNAGNEIVVRKLDYFAEIRLDRNFEKEVIPTFEGEFVPFKNDAMIWAFQCESTKEELRKKGVTLLYHTKYGTESESIPRVFSVQRDRLYFLETEDPFGFHLIYVNNRSENITIDYFQDNKPRYLYLLVPEIMDTYFTLPYDDSRFFGNFATGAVSNLTGYMILDFYPADHPDIYLIFRQMNEQVQNLANQTQKLLISNHKVEQAKNRIMREEPEPVYEDDDIDDDDALEDYEDSDNYEDDIITQQDKVPQKIIINNATNGNRGNKSKKYTTNRISKKTTQQLPKQEAKQRIDKEVDDIQQKIDNIQDK